MFISALILWVLPPVSAQYIQEVLEYKPAPGQLINVSPWGTPQGVRSLEGDVRGTVSLGAFGGYVVFRFGQAVENDPQNPYGIDFTLFGNPVPGWAEPGVVWVMKDENENGEADDTWYELAGSDTWFTSTAKAYRVTYINPGGDQARDVPWEDNREGRGIIRANEAHPQPYYPLQDSFPAIDSERYTLAGTLLKGHLVDDISGIRSTPRAFGYADNRPAGSLPYTLPDNPYTGVLEHSGGDAFDIGWAVDSTGSYIDLDRIHFVRVQSGMLADGGWLGELSTELAGAVDIPPDPSISGETEMVVIGDLPAVLEVDEYPLEVFVFQNGRPQSGKSVEWTTSRTGATVSADQLLQLTEEGPLTLTASLTNRPEIRDSVYTMVQWTSSSGLSEHTSGSRPVLFPNPATDYFRISGSGTGSVTLYNSSGLELIRVERYPEGMEMEISSCPPGIYLVKLEEALSTRWFKLIKP